MLAAHANLDADPLPPIQEAAVLFAAGHSAAARSLIESQLATPGGRGDARAHAMLAELDDAYVPAAPIEVPGTFALEGIVAAEHRGIPALAVHARARRAFAIDLGRVERIDFSFAGDFAAMLHGFHAAGRRVILVNCRELELALLEAMGAGRYVSFLRRATAGLARAAA